jgi:4-hydroxybenzoate polyprenyltransferase
MFEFIATTFALGLVAQIVFWALVGLLFPLFWVWMIADAALRRDDEYPSGGSNEKVIWILLMVFFQVVCVAYFFVVFRKRERGAAVAGSPVGA